MLATGGAAVTKIMGSAPAAETTRDDLNLSGDAFKVIIDVLRSALQDRNASSVHIAQVSSKEDVLRSLSHDCRSHIDQLSVVYGLESDNFFFCKNTSRLSWIQMLPLTLLLPLEPVQCSKLRALKLPKSLVRDR
jgi:hypothetical protein